MVKSPDVIVIGGGLFGSVIGHTLALSGGMQVMIVDDQHLARGSDPAACLIKPSWVSSLTKEELADGLKLLNDLYGVQDIRFSIGPLMHATVHWVDPAKILGRPEFRVRRTAKLLMDGTVQTRDWMKKPPIVVVASGYWTNIVLEDKSMHVPIEGRAGAAFTWEGQIATPFISPWAPYRQLVAFNRSPNEIWVGDGSAIKPENWTLEHMERSLHRCAKAVGLDPDKAKQHYGIRPYVKDAKPCYLKRHGNVWIATGGAKNGTISAAWAAQKILEAHP